MKIADVVSYLNERFHPEYQEDYDNSGFLVGNADSECRGVLVALDVTPQVIDEALSLHFNMIVTHHPLIFSGVKRITADTMLGGMLYKLIANDIAVYAAHTNLDNLKDGVNGALAAKLHLSDCRILRAMDAEGNLGAGMVGHLPQPLPLDDFLLQVKQTLGLSVVRTSLPCRRQVQTVAICGGSGAFLIGDAIRAQADIFLTADLKYHDFQKAEQCIVIADIGHYESEQYAKDLICSVISQKFSTFACRISKSTNSYIRYF
ncbi:MAG: Nif3-like dinuclear metal center hexameric protein [Bacteroidales bacterium]|nr:Nif3-like dinuclear metal center hexameric protein [Bacteroidales bacterium]